MVRGGRVAAAVIAVLVLASACAARQVAGAQAAPSRQAANNPDAHEQLRRDLRAIFSARTVDHGLWSVAVHSLKRGETLYLSLIHI